MSLESDLFHRFALRPETLIPYGFTENKEGTYTIQVPFMNREFCAVLSIRPAGNSFSVLGKVTETATGEDYDAIYASARRGPYVSMVREEYLHILEDIARHCFTRIPFRGERVWVTPANPKIYDIEGALSLSDTTTWPQHSNVAVGDTVFLYMTAPIMAVRFRLTAEKVNLIGPEGDREMLLHLEKTYPYDWFPKSLLIHTGITNIRGARLVTEAFIEEVKRREHLNI